MLSRRRSRTSRVWLTALARSAQSRAPEGVVWPMPLPFPSLHRAKANRKQADSARKLALNFIVLNLNCLHGCDLHFSKVMPGLGTPLNKAQWRVVKRLTPHVDAWNGQPEVGPEQMGRSAAKVENLEEFLGELEQVAHPIAAELKSYLGRSRSGMQTSWGFRGSPGEVVGQMKHSAAHLAKEVEPQRYRFVGVPDFDPMPFMNEDNAARLSPELHDEIMAMVALTPLSCIDLRLRPSTTVIASDASSTSEAAVSTKLSAPAVAELQRHTLQKGMWNKLLTPFLAYLKERGLEEEIQELPEGEFDMHFEEVVCSKQFRPFGPVQKIKKRRHINLGEIRAALKAERKQGLEEPGTYYLHLQDSQVSLAALCKGRSSSRSVNKLLRASIPWHVALNNKQMGAFVRSKKNPADDPTRNAKLRKPSRTEAMWLRELEEGKFEKFDEMLKEQAADLKAISGLPEEEELLRKPKTTFQSSKAHRSHERKRQKKEIRGSSFHLGADEGAGAQEQQVMEEQPVHEIKGVFPSGGAQLDLLVKRELLKFEASQFVFSKSFPNLEAALDSGPGFLDLFSGARGMARSLAKQAATWTLCFDLKDGEDQDLLSLPLQKRLSWLVTRGAFRAMGAAPVCASFSMAVTPPCRSAEYPAGKPDVSEKQQLKNLLGNQMLQFVLFLAKKFSAKGLRFWVENPDGSWMWRQIGELSWEPLMEDPATGDFRVDYCRFKTPWRKRTRFRCNLHLAGLTVFCTCKGPHVPLRGRCKEKNCSYTKLAEPYPRGLCDLVSRAMLVDTGLLPKARKLNQADCAKVGTMRVGEASNPGPRGAFRHRSAGQLLEVTLLEPATVLMRSKLWRQFLNWFALQFPEASADDWMHASPYLFVQALVAYGYDAFESGMPLHYYRQLLAHVQREHSYIRPHMFAAWQTVTKWEALEPVQHRPPLPEPVLLAMACVGLSWKWVRWTAVLMGSFYSIARVGELLRARRADVMTPTDLLDPDEKLYIRITEPKTRRRGARVQYVTIDAAFCKSFLAAIWDDIPKEEFLYPASAGAFRSRWNAVLRHLRIGPEHRLTPGSLRAGGAVAAHKRGVPISDLLWRMRLQHQQTLAFYLQETTAMSIFPALPSEVRDRIQSLRAALPLFIQMGP
eukprot:Skav218672  [mRNA]  locus=scaffold44:102316:106746:- [translate_table: standard]